MRFNLLAVTAMGLLMGCEPLAPSTTPPPSTTTAGPMSPEPSTGYSAGATDPTNLSSNPDPNRPPPAPDNTGVNRRDADGGTKTPLDQDENTADVQRTAEIRKRVLDQVEMSVNARNVKIITSAGKVTLRGPVNSQKERDTIEGIARDVAGAANVVSEIEVATP